MACKLERPKASQIDGRHSIGWPRRALRRSQVGDLAAGAGDALPGERGHAAVAVAVPVAQLVAWVEQRLERQQCGALCGSSKEGGGGVGIQVYGVGWPVQSTWADAYGVMFGCRVLPSGSHNYSHAPFPNIISTQNTAGQQRH